jgi:hypothetical protein
MAIVGPECEGELRLERWLPVLIALAGAAIYANSFAVPFV